MLEADILSTCWNKDCMMWHIPQWLFWETITVSHVCCNSVNHSNGDKSTLNYCIYSSVWHFKFPKVVQAHTLGEVGILDTVLLRVYSWTILTIFIEISSYLTDREQKISWHSFFWDTVYCIQICLPCSVFTVLLCKTNLFAVKWQNSFCNVWSADEVFVCFSVSWWLRSWSVSSRSWMITWSDCSDSSHRWMNWDLNGFRLKQIFRDEPDSRKPRTN